MKWRPIKTAPKNEMILLAQPPTPAKETWTVLQGRWITVPHTNAIMNAVENQQPMPKAEPHWIVAYPGIMDLGGAYNGKSYEDRSMIFYPTHWMPLPPAPKVKTR